MGERGLHCFGYLPHTFDPAVLGYTRLTFYDVQACGFQRDERGLKER